MRNIDQVGLSVDLTNYDSLKSSLMFEDLIEKQNEARGRENTRSTIVKSPIPTLNRKKHRPFFDDSNLYLIRPDSAEEAVNNLLTKCSQNTGSQKKFAKFNHKMIKKQDSVSTKLDGMREIIERIKKTEEDYYGEKEKKEQVLQEEEQQEIKKEKKFADMLQQSLKKKILLSIKDPRMMCVINELLRGKK